MEMLPPNKQRKLEQTRERCNQCGKIFHSDIRPAYNYNHSHVCGACLSAINAIQAMKSTT